MAQPVVKTPSAPKNLVLSTGKLLSPALRTVPLDTQGAYFGKCRSVDRFEKVSRVGEGTYGVVYKVRDKDHDGRVCALKKVRMDQEQDGLPLSCLREIATLRRLRHENIVRVDEVVVGNKSDDFYMVMEYCEQDLGTLLDHMDQPYSRAEVKCLVQQLLHGLDYCHSMGVIHRDLKMSNLLLNARGVLKIADFGLARQIPDDPAVKLSPKVVTLWYRAPELLFFTEKYGYAVDLWSLGCITAEFLRHNPFLPGASELEQIRLIVGVLGPPHEGVWRGWETLQRSHPHPYSWPRGQIDSLKRMFPQESQHTIEFLQGLLTYDPERRMGIASALAHPYFSESPKAVEHTLLPTFPEIRIEARERRKRRRL